MNKLAYLACTGAALLLAAPHAVAADRTGTQLAALSNMSSAPAQSQSQIAAAPGLGQDGLHADRRWPQFANCVNNTVSRQEFVSCLRTAYLSDGTGTELALLGR